MTTGYDDPGIGDRASSDRERVIRLVSAYGASPRKWPENLRHLAAQDMSMFAEQFAAEAELDAVLANTRDAEISDEFRARLLSRYEALMQRKNARLSSRIAVLIDGVRESIWPGAPLWKPAFAFSLSLLVGLSAGYVAADPLSDTDDQEAGIQDAPTALDLAPGQ